MTGSISGVSQLASGLRAAADQLATTAPVHHAAAELVLARAQPPRRTGKLSGSAEIQATDAAGRLVYTARYAAAVHARNPWLTRALQAAATDVVDLYVGHARQATRRIRI
jgi:hypothetical protein